nr:MAG TPA: hypothetical protein [Caudoviricetes sp.]
MYSQNSGNSGNSIAPMRIKPLNSRAPACVRYPRQLPFPL